MLLRQIIFLTTTIFLYSCTTPVKQEEKPIIDKVLLISLDSSINCENLFLNDTIVNLKKQFDYSCSVVDTLGNLQDLPVVKTELNGREKQYVENVLTNLKRDSFELQYLTTVQPIYRDAVLFFKKGDKRPFKVFSINFSSNAIASKGIKYSSDEYWYTFPELEDLSKIFIKHGMKNGNSRANWR
jgi:hypothetical protein